MRYLLALLAAALSGAYAYADATTWTAPIVPEAVTNVVTTTVATVTTNTATTVRLRNINVYIPPEGSATINIGWEWLDDGGAVIRRGHNRYTEEQLDTLLTGAGASLADLKQLFMGLSVAEANMPAVPQAHHK